MHAAARLSCILLARDLGILALVSGLCRLVSCFGRLLVVYCTSFPFKFVEFVNTLKTLRQN
jgi:hypothetical protein